MMQFLLVKTITHFVPDLFKDSIFLNCPEILDHD